MDDPSSGPVLPAELPLGGQLQGSQGSLFPATRAANVKFFQIGRQRDFRFLEELFKLESARTNKFGFKHVDGSWKARMGGLGYRRNPF